MDDPIKFEDIVYFVLDRHEKITICTLQTMLPFVHVCISSFTGQMVLPCLSDQTQLHLHHCICICICICACVYNVHCISSFTGGQMVGGCLSDQTLLHLHLWDLLVLLVVLILVLLLLVETQTTNGCAVPV